MTTRTSAAARRRVTLTVLRRRLALPLAVGLAVLVVLLAGTVPGQAASTDPLAARPFYVDPDTWAGWASRAHPSSQAKMIAGTAQTRWITSSTPTRDVRAAVDRYVGSATRAERLPLLTLYAIPHRDCGGYSAGGLADRSAYAAWIAEVVRGIGGRAVGVVLEPDALASLDCLPAAARTARYAMLGDAVRRLSASRRTALYIDVGHSQWLSPTTAASRLKTVGVSRARGFSLNVSNFLTTKDQVAYGEKVAALTGGRHYVVDTSRNGRGPAPRAPLNWCNPPGRGLGSKPTTRTAGAHADAYLWIKHPGESDGECGRAEPASGRWFDSYAVGLAQRAVSG